MSVWKINGLERNGAGLVDDLWQYVNDDTSKRIVVS